MSSLQDNSNPSLTYSILPGRMRNSWLRFDPLLLPYARHSEELIIPSNIHRCKSEILEPVYIAYYYVYRVIPIDQREYPSHSGCVVRYEQHILVFPIAGGASSSISRPRVLPPPNRSTCSLAAGRVVRGVAPLPIFRVIFALKQ